LDLFTVFSDGRIRFLILPGTNQEFAYALYLRDRRISLHIAALCARYSFHVTSTAIV
jgi:hypothetical protein